jgi:hypothetical protein
MVLEQSQNQALDRIRRSKNAQWGEGGEEKTGVLAAPEVAVGIPSAGVVAGEANAAGAVAGALVPGLKEKEGVDGKAEVPVVGVAKGLAGAAGMPDAFCGCSNKDKTGNSFM